MGERSDGIVGVFGTPTAIELVGIAVDETVSTVSSVVSFASLGRRRDWNFTCISSCNIVAIASIISTVTNSLARAKFATVEARRVEIRYATS